MRRVAKLLHTVGLELTLPRDLKAVTIWLQNKRQAVKKSTVETRSGSASRLAAPPLRRTMSVPDTRASRSEWGRTSSAPPQDYKLPRVSLDAFADRSSKRHVTAATTAPAPGTPTREHEEDSLWDRMPSSPHAPPSSPSSDFRKLAPLGKRRTMEWACAQDRARRSAEKQRRRRRRSTTPVVSPARTQFSVDTDTTLEDDELRTPDASVVFVDPIDGSITKKNTAMPTRRDSETADILLMLAGQRL